MTTLAGTTLEGLTLSQWRAALRPIHDAFYEDLVGTAECGAFDGGCVVVAQALQQVIGGEVVGLTRSDNEGVDHAAVLQGGRLWDYDGPLVPKRFIARFERNELNGMLWHCTGFRPLRDGDLPNAHRDPALEARLAALFRQALAVHLSPPQGSLLSNSKDHPAMSTPTVIAPEAVAPQCVHLVYLNLKNANQATMDDFPTIKTLVLVADSHESAVAYIREDHPPVLHDCPRYWSIEPVEMNNPRWTPDHQFFDNQGIERGSRREALAAWQPYGEALAP